MAVMRDETFGPVLPIMAVSGPDQALALANDSLRPELLGVDRDADRGAALAAGLEAGNVCVNDVIVSYGVPALPFGGVKESGIGRVHGPEGCTSSARSSPCSPTASASLASCGGSRAPSPWARWGPACCGCATAAAWTTSCAPCCPSAMSGRVHHYRATCSWAGSTARGLRRYDREHRASRRRPPPSWR